MPRSNPESSFCLTSRGQREVVDLLNSWGGKYLVTCHSYIGTRWTRFLEVHKAPDKEIGPGLNNLDPVRFEIPGRDGVVVMPMSGSFLCIRLKPQTDTAALSGFCDIRPGDPHAITHARHMPKLAKILKLKLRHPEKRKSRTRNHG